MFEGDVLEPPEPQVREDWHTLRHQSPATLCWVPAVQLYLPTTTRNCLQVLRTLSVACFVNHEGVGIRVFPRNCPKVLQPWDLRGSEKATYSMSHGLSPDSPRSYLNF